MKNNLGQLGEMHAARQEQTRKRAQATGNGPRLGVPPSKVGNQLKDASGDAPINPELRSVPEARSPAPVLQRQSPTSRTEAGSRSAKPRTAALATSTTASAPELLDKATIWLSSSDQQTLDGIAHAARSRTPRISLSRSAIARLAITRLADQLTAAQVVDILDAVPASGSPGRPRR